MSVTTSNETERLFSLALGEHWVRAGLLARTDDELKAVGVLASDHVGNALNQLESIGRAMGAGDAADLDVNLLGWAITNLAEYASVCLYMAEEAVAMRDPKIRDVTRRVVQDIA
jgi:hypothetical protein